MFHWYRHLRSKHDCIMITWINAYPIYIGRFKVANFHSYMCTLQSGKCRMLIFGLLQPKWVVFSVLVTLQSMYILKCIVVHFLNFFLRGACVGIRVLDWSRAFLLYNRWTILGIYMPNEWLFYGIRFGIQQNDNVKFVNDNLSEFSSTKWFSSRLALCKPTLFVNWLSCKMNINIFYIHYIFYTIFKQLYPIEKDI